MAKATHVTAALLWLKVLNGSKRFSGGNAGAEDPDSFFSPRLYSQSQMKTCPLPNVSRPLNKFPFRNICAGGPR